MVFLRDQHGFFDDLVTMLVALSSYMFTMNVSMANSNRTAPGALSKLGLTGLIEELTSHNHTLRIRRADNSAFVVFPSRILLPISRDIWPKQVEYEIEKVPVGEFVYSLKKDGNRRVISGIIGSSFVNYYAGCEDLIKKRYGTNPNTWPDPIRFAWHIRNGFAHGGKLAIRNQSLRSASWQKFTLDASYDGQSCLFDHGSLGPGDVILLMEDMDKLFARSN